MGKKWVCSVWTLLKLHYCHDPVHDLTPTHHQRSPAHHMDSCTTLTVALHLRLQIPSPIALTTQLIALNSLLITLNTHSWLHWSHGYLSHGLPLCHCRVLFEHPPDVSHIPSLSVFCYSFCSMLPGSWSSACYLNYLSALPSGYCLPIVDHARLPEYSSALPSVYLFAICSTLPVFWLCLLIKASRWIRMPLILSALLQLYTGNLNLLSLFCLCFAHRGSELTTCKLLWSHHSMFPTTSAYDLTFFRFHCVHR